MKKSLLLIFSYCLLVKGFVSAQTQPTAQPLPYQQNFDSWPHSATTFPDGWGGWTLTGSPSGNFNTLAPASDKALIANGSASGTANGVYNYNGKAGFLNSGSVDNAIVLSIITTGKTNIQFSYDVMTLRNPYDGNSNTRVNEVTLQYRIGTTGAFTNITGTEYQNNTTTQTGSGITTPQNVATKSILLPAECYNQPVVQLRWANRQISGAGSRPAFAVDNVTAGSSGGDNTPPELVSLSPVHNGTDISPVTQPAITFSENILAANGNLTLYNLSQGTQQVFPIGNTPVAISNASLTLQVKLKPNTAYAIRLDSAAITDVAGNAFTGIDSSNWHFTTGQQALTFNFNDCSPNGSTNISGGFLQYSVAGAQTWGCTTFGQNNSNAVQINGFSNGAVDNEDWLISPSFDLTGFNFPLLQFASRTRFAGPSLQLLVSTDYSGSGNPRNATWSTLNGRFPAIDSDVWQLSEGINLSNFKQANVYIAFVYTSSPALAAARWTIDDVSITNSTTAPAPSISNNTRSLEFDYVPAGQRSAAQSLSFWANDLSANLTVSVPANFQLSRDSSGTYSQSISINAADANAGTQTIWVRFAPTTADQTYNGNLSFTSTGLNNTATTLSGTSLRSLKVVNWNIEWFGSPAQDPSNDDLQQANVTTILKKLDADIFALAEVVDTARIKTVVSQMPGYSYQLSDFGSYADNPADPDYAGAQKLAFVYKTAVVKKINTYGVLRQGGSTNAYYNWSSGRFPYLMEAETNLNGDTARIRFVLLHAKANTGTAADKRQSWQRRKDGNKELKDSLDRQYPYDNVLILGDFNDDLDKTITTEMAPDTTSSYIDFISDTARYIMITRPLSLAGKKSTASFNDMIDHVMGSDEMKIAYLPGSASVQQQVEKLVASYSTTTTDHYPVLSRYSLKKLANPIPVNNFTAIQEGNQIKTTWNTSYETNAAYFVVERSLNKRSFEKVDSVGAQGTTSQVSQYQTYDERPWLGNSYYRLKTVSLNGNIKYSDIQPVFVRSKNPLLDLLWCLIGHFLQIWLDIDKTGPANVELVDLQGRTRYQGQMNFIKGRNYKTLDVSSLPGGIYFLRVHSGKDVQVKKIFVPK